MNGFSRTFTLLAALFIAAAFFYARPAGEPGVRMRDFEAYYSAGATWLAHRNPYSLDIWSAESHVPGVVTSRREVLPFVGLPATLPFWALFTRFPYDKAATIWLAALGASLAAVIIGAWRIARLTGPQFVIVALLAASFVPITSDFVLGQAALPAYACALIAILSMPTFAVLAIAFSALQPNVALGLVTLLFSRRTAFALLNAAIIVYLAGAVAQGPRWPFMYASVLSAHSAAERLATIQYTPAAILHGFGWPANLSLGVTTLLALVVGGAAFVGAFRKRDPLQRFAIACCAIPFVAGFFHDHDFVVLFVPAILAIAYAETPAVATFATVLAGVNWLDFAQQPQGAAQDLILAAALLCVSLALRPERQQIWGVALSAIVLFFGAWLGHVHSLHIWPNDMAGVPIGSTVAEVWKSEQLQTGLLRPDAAAALLRSFALIGSALLLYLNLNIDVHHIVERRESVGMEVL